MRIKFFPAGTPFCMYLLDISDANKFVGNK